MKIEVEDSGDEAETPGVVSTDVGPDDGDNMKVKEEDHQHAAAENIEPEAWAKAASQRSRGQRIPQDRQGGQEGSSPFPAQIRVCRTGTLRSFTPEEHVRYDPGELSRAQVRNISARLASSEANRDANR